ncbi:hypothetical protein AX16_010858 [Volvariella volvacea WC 439]|nr:hypothetical protein AX16_010858 [Volvariella volvacea WC 439]
MRGQWRALLYRSIRPTFTRQGPTKVLPQLASTPLEARLKLMGDQYDQDLARAIALSLEDSRPKTPASKTVIDLVSDDDEEIDPKYEAELKRTLEASQSKSQAKMNAIPIVEHQSPPPAQPAPYNPLSAFLSERGQLEKQRIERQKRLRENAGLEDVNDDKRPAKRQHLSSSIKRSLDESPSSSRSSSPKASVPAATNSVPTGEQFFWNGELRQTATRYGEPRKDGKPTFRLSEILGDQTEIAFAVISSYALNIAWIYQFFDRSTPIILVGQPGSDGQASMKYVLPNWIKTTPPLRGGWGCMHMKFMLLFYKSGRLRVVVSTANLIPYDWRDMENTAWVQDIPLKPNPTPHDAKATEDFPAMLQFVLNSVHVKQALLLVLKDYPNLPLRTIEELRMRWDWSKVSVHLIASIAGKHEGWPSVIRTGHPRLMKILRNTGMSLGKDKVLDLECQGSSLGTYTTQWMNEFYCSARGDSAESWLDEPKKGRERLPYPPIKVIFPTKGTVKASAAGEPGGGTIFCRRKQWEAKNYPRDHFYDSKSKAGFALMHSKMILALIRDAASASKPTEVHDSDTEESDDEIEEVQPAIGWLYVGSHNFTPSAWGTLSGSAFNPILNISNYELGIVFPVKTEEQANSLACWQRPPRKYVTGQDDPWIQEESPYFQA